MLVLVAVAEVHTPNSRAVTSTEATPLEVARLVPDWVALISSRTSTVIQLRASTATRGGSRPAARPLVRWTQVPEPSLERVPAGSLTTTTSTVPRLVPEAAPQANRP